ncbi:MAG: Crp/Fnr family transcriptional regulator [Cytophagaceae bacterium]|nr:Crp/Fnr family transcriptional regulator [Cytophagaceae bacterium]
MDKLQIPGNDCEIFNNLKLDTLHKLNAIREIKNFQKGDSIFYPGKSQSGLYCVHKGSVKIFKNDQGGNPRIFYISRPGELIGWELLEQSFPTKEAVALEDVTLSCFPLLSFVEIMKQDSTLAFEFARYLCKGKLMLETKLFHDSLQQKLAFNLLILMEKFGKSQEANNMLIQLPLSKTELAHLIGTNPETVIKMLSRFRKDGIIDFLDKRMLILNPVELRKMSSY